MANNDLFILIIHVNAIITNEYTNVGKIYIYSSNNSCV